MTPDERAELTELLPMVRDAEAQWHEQAKRVRSSSGGTAHETPAMNYTRGNVAAAMDALARAQGSYRQAIERALSS